MVKIKNKSSSSTITLAITEESDVDVREEPNLKGDYFNVAVLLFLYLLQGAYLAPYFVKSIINDQICFTIGIPLGISAAIPLLLQKKDVSYANQAGYSLVFYPFACK